MLQKNKNNPEKHVDIDSETVGFAAHVAVFRSIEELNIRELIGLKKAIIKN